MNVPFFQHEHHFGTACHSRSPSPYSWASTIQWQTQLHESTTNPAGSPKHTTYLQNPHICAVSDQTHVATSVCADACNDPECSAPVCDSPDCDEDIFECTNVIECTDKYCSQPPVEGACHDKSTRCAGTLPPDVLDSANILAALRPASESYTDLYQNQSTNQYVPLCVAVSGGYYNPETGHDRLYYTGSQNYLSGLVDNSMYSAPNNLVSHSFGMIDGYGLGHSHSDSNCQYPGIYYNMADHIVPSIPFNNNIPTKLDALTWISQGQHQACRFSEDSTPSTISPFASPPQTASDSMSDMTLPLSLSSSKSIPHVETCRWITGKHVCGHTFESKAELQTHVQQVHTAPLRKSDGFICEWLGCQRREKGGDSFAQRSKLDRHIQSHTGCKLHKLSDIHKTNTVIDKASVCSICGQQFSTSQSLLLHERTHSGVKPHKCPHIGCNYAAAQASQLSTSHPYPHNRLITIPFPLLPIS
jgi:hypothetical protein